MAATGTPTVPTDAAAEAQPVEDSLLQYPISLLDFRKRYRKILLVFGITEVLIGGFLIFLTIATLTIAKGPNYYFGGNVYCFFGDFFTYVGMGIWCGTCGLTAGVLGIVIKIKQSASLYVTNMTVAIITAHFSCVGAILSSLAARFSVCSNDLRELHIGIACLCITMLAVNIAHATVCCSRTCCDEGYVIPRQIISSLTQQNLVYQQTALASNPCLIISEQPDPVPILQPEKHEQIYPGAKNRENDDGKIIETASNLPQILLESRVDRSIQLLKPEKAGETDEIWS